MQHTLETHAWFPYIAWTTVIGFSFFTITLIIQLNNTITDLGTKTAGAEMYLRAEE